MKTSSAPIDQSTRLLGCSCSHTTCLGGFPARQTVLYSTWAQPHKTAACNNSLAGAQDLAQLLRTVYEVDLHSSTAKRRAQAQVQAAAGLLKLRIKVAVLPNVLQRAVPKVLCARRPAPHEQLSKFM